MKKNVLRFLVSVFFIATSLGYLVFFKYLTMETLGSLLISTATFPKYFGAEDIQMSTSSDSSLLKHPYYFQECYTYKGLGAQFTCTDSHSFESYSYEDIIKCASNLWEEIRNKSDRNPWNRPPFSSNSSSHRPSAADIVAISERESVHFFLVGDSHIRNIFEVFMRRIQNPRVFYRHSRMKEDIWINYNHLPTLVCGINFELLHLDVPLKVTFIWDEYLEKLPEMLSSWMSGKQRKPDFLLLGSALHYMVRERQVYFTHGLEVSSRPYIKHLRKLSPQLETFSRTTQVVFKLQDHLQEDPYNNHMAKEIIDHYNRWASKLLPRSPSFIVWNSTIPLSDFYKEECRKNGSVLPKNRDWNCHDVRHLGYKVIDQYLDMCLNDICCCLQH